MIGIMHWKMNDSRSSLVLVLVGAKMEIIREVHRRTGHFGARRTAQLLAATYLQITAAAEVCGARQLTRRLTARQGLAIGMVRQLTARAQKKWLRWRRQLVSAGKQPASGVGVVRLSEDERAHRRRDVGVSRCWVG